MRSVGSNFLFANAIMLHIISGVFLLSFPTYAAEPVPPGVGVTEKLGETIDPHLQFRNEKGQVVPLSSFLGTKPVILTMVYFNCPSLCNTLLNALLKSLRSIDWTVGDQFDVVTVSIHPQEGPSLAAEKKDAYTKNYGRLEGKKGWHFLTGDENQIKALAEQVGFGYRYDPEAKEYAHAAAIMVLTPTGKVSRYLYGIDFPEKNIKLSLLEAANGKMGTTLDRVLYYCYRYDPNSKTYAIAAINVMKLGGGLMVLLMGIYFLRFWRRQKLREEHVF